MNKIIYFDKETIQNILQEYNKGAITKKVDVSSSTQFNAEIGVGTKIDLGVPFWDRLKFLISGSLALSYMINRDSMTTISSTEISEFEKIKDELENMVDVQIRDIENSSTFFRVAGGYLRIVKGGVEGIDTKEFKSVMDSYDGYDTYKLDENRYVRFNNLAFVSNYKRNDLLTTVMTLYCIPVGKFKKEDFDFYKQIMKMQDLVTGIETQQTLAEMFPPSVNNNNSNNSDDIVINSDTSKGDKNIILYDAVYACIKVGE